MSRTLIAVLALMAVAAPAVAADEQWQIFGGDGSAFGLDRSSVRKDASGAVTFRHGSYGSPVKGPAAVGGVNVVGLIGETTINCKDKWMKAGPAAYVLPDGSERAVPAPPEAKFAAVPPSDPRTVFGQMICDGRRPPDSYKAVGRAKALATLKRISAEKHVTASANKGWVYAIGDSARLVAIDTSATKKTGGTVTQTELSWMRDVRVTDGKPWRYNVTQVEYDCAAAKRRMAGALQVFGPDDQVVHEETVSGAAWTPVDPKSPAGFLLQMACQNRPLLGLPSGAKPALLARLKDLASEP